ncbi:MAG: monoheme cytochrome C [Cryomorphaceae bacterium]|nr:monoheme cytochrome C [Flavobacteriales bacterium]
MREDKQSRNFIVLMVLMTVLSAAIAFTDKNEGGNAQRALAVEKEEPVPDFMAEVKDGIHVPSGLKAGTHLELVLGNCLACHSADVIRNTRLSKEGWNSIIEWMQEKQNLWDLGNNHDKIVAYLSENYAPEAQGRRRNLAIKANDWYELKN